MPRKVPDAPDFHKPTSTHEEITLHLKTITPYFGGGYEPREIAEDYPIRAASIRGHLRFWWRATAGAQYNTPQALHAAESELWGSAAKPSKNGEIEGGPGKVSLIVIPSKKPLVFKDSHTWVNGGVIANFARPCNGWPGYALQPFQGSKPTRVDEITSAQALCDYEFILILRLRNSTDQEQMEKYKTQICQSCKAWIDYGGIGARTRRGCGTLQLVESNLDSIPLIPANTVNCPVLKGSKFVLGEPTNNPVEAWNVAVETYRSFRQQRTMGRDENNRPRPGRSHWPEPEALRLITRQRLTKHQALSDAKRVFPRADLGLPITFHFQDNRYDSRDANINPADTTLEGADENRTRFGSPVITKVLPAQGGQYVPLLLVLNTPHVWEQSNLVLHYKDEKIVLFRPSEQDIDVAKLPGAKPNQKIREALLEFAAKRLKKEIKTL